MSTNKNTFQNLSIFNYEIRDFAAVLRNLTVIVNSLRRSVT